MKTCSKCGESKPLDAFYADKRERDGKRWPCKACHHKYQNTPEHKAYQRKYAQTPERKVTMRKYNQTPEGKAIHRKYEQTPEARRAIAYVRFDVEHGLLLLKTRSPRDKSAPSLMRTATNASIVVPKRS